MAGNASAYIERLQTFLNQWETRFAEWEREAPREAPPEAPLVQTLEQIRDHWVRFNRIRSAVAARTKTGTSPGNFGTTANTALDLLDAFVSGYGRKNIR